MFNLVEVIDDDAVEVVEGNVTGMEGVVPLSKVKSCVGDAAVVFHVVRGSLTFANLRIVVSNLRFRICVSSRVTVGSRHDLSKIAHIFCVRCREVLKACSRGSSMMADTMAASEFAYRRGLR